MADRITDQDLKALVGPEGIIQLEPIWNNDPTVRFHNVIIKGNTVRSDIEKLAPATPEVPQMLDAA